MIRNVLPPIALILGLGLAPLLAEEAQAKPQRQARRAERLASHLNLSAEQRTQIRAIHDRQREAMKAHRDALQQARKAFFEAQKTPDAPLDRLRTLHQAMSDKAFDLLAARRAVRLEARAILTPEQREQAAELRGRMQGVRERGGRRMGQR